MAAALCLACGGSRGHDLEQGDYAFTELEVLGGDPCGLLPATGLWDGAMVRSGDYVRIDYQLLSLGLIGYYRYSVEEFYADGTAEEVTVPVAGGSCQVDQLAVHLTAITRSSIQFEGALTVRTYARADEACECELSVTYRADRQ